MGSTMSLSARQATRDVYSRAHMTRDSGVTNLLAWLAGLAVLGTALLIVIYVMSVHKLHIVQSLADRANRSRTSLNLLVGDLVEYSKRNPAIDPILQSIGIRTRAATPQGQGAAKP